MTVAPPDPALVGRFTAALAALAGPSVIEEELGLAVSGGPDSLALLLLANAAFPGRCRVATVDHRLRAESSAEAMQVARLCAALSVPHEALTLTAPEQGVLVARASLQSSARRFRYAHLRRWAAAHRLRRVLTAHHADDQAETLLMRLARGSGLSGLSGVRAVRAFPRSGGTTSVVTPDTDYAVLRPLLGFTKAELVDCCRAAGVSPADDPANHDPRHDRTHARKLLAGAAWLDARRVASTATCLAEADEALAWAAREEMARRARPARAAAHFFDLDRLPHELLRRIVLAAISQVEMRSHYDPDRAPPRGPELDRLIAAVSAGGTATLGHVAVRRRGPVWSFAPAPPRRPTRDRSVPDRSA